MNLGIHKTKKGYKKFKNLYLILNTGKREHNQLVNAMHTLSEMLFNSFFVAINSAIENSVSPVRLIQIESNIILSLLDGEKQNLNDLIITDHGDPGFSNLMLIDLDKHKDRIAFIQRAFIRGNSDAIIIDVNEYSGSWIAITYYQFLMDYGEYLARILQENMKIKPVTGERIKAALKNLSPIKSEKKFKELLKPHCNYDRLINRLLVCEIIEVLPNGEKHWIGYTGQINEVGSFITALIELNYVNTNKRATLFRAISIEFNKEVKESNYYDTPH
jgi:hypothetical protein